jgi:urease accessory protein
MIVGTFAQSAGSLLGTLQLSDSLFPSGRYTLSHGLEMFVESGRVHDEASLRLVIHDYLLQSLARCEAVAVASAWQAATDDDLETLIDIDRHLHALRLPAEASAASVRTGNQFIRTALQLVDNDLLRRFQGEVEAGRTIGGHATVIGMVTVAWGIDQTTAVLSELYAYTAALVSAALRLIRLDHVHAQSMVLQLHADMEAACEVAVETPYQDMQAFAPMIDIMQMQHERSRMRMFAS